MGNDFTIIGRNKIKVMTNNYQYCTIEQSKELKSLGVLVDSVMIFVGAGLDTDEMEIETNKDYSAGYEAAAYSAAELSKMLPSIVGCKNNLDDDYFISLHCGRNGWHVQYVTNKKDVVVNSEGEIDRPKNHLFNTYRVNYSLAQAMASYLILLLESKVIAAATVNDRFTS